MDFMEVIYRRRSIRAYQSDPIAPEKIEQLLEAARQAPSWKNLQCWRFIVVSSQQKREAVAKAFSPTNPGAKALLEAPCIIVLCANPAESERWEEKDFFMLDAGLAMEHLILAATDLGLATCWQGLFREEKIREALGIPPQIRVIALTPLGYPNQERNPRPRKNLEDIAFREVWANPW
ncbi:MAG: nitroreductase family protein [Desulfitobacteriaceae bacterium]|nr:nitroreductase family protein [Desulfitobacteriaceae bacterium]MDI6880400.1 nitroreductase family protein [Desulfitobacteriaceae bacterium]MDI6915097.1 nitroreductase family protein [Desulfitobacteriaceae bacterium]